MNMQWFSKYEGEIRTLKLTSDPLCHGLGYYRDTDGNTWDVNCVIGGMHTKSGKPYINARLVDGSPYYSTATGGHSFGYHKWIPYYFEVHEKETQKNSR